MTSSELVLVLVTQLEGSLTRVADDLTNLAKLKVQKLPDIAALSPEMAAITMEGAIEAIEPIVQEITLTISEDRGLMEEWKKSSIKFRGEDKSDAEKWISAFRKTRKVDETISALKSLRRDHSLVVTEARTLYKKAKAAMPRAAAPAAAAPAPIAPSFKLPEVKLPMFDGDIGSFQSFWGLFTTIVDGAHASPEQKFSLLKTKLMGEPLNLVRDLPLTAANYDSAKNLLNDRYGNPKAIARQVRAQLFALPQCKSRHEVKEVYYHAEALLIQLEAITGSQCNSDEILQFLEQRLPGYYLERLINKRRPVVDWDLRQFRVLMPQLKIFVKFFEKSHFYMNLRPYKRTLRYYKLLILKSKHRLTIKLVFDSTSTLVIQLTKWYNERQMTVNMAQWLSQLCSKTNLRAF